MRFCERCGARNDDDARFCVSCGKPVDAGVPVNEAQPVPAQSYSAPAPAPEPAQIPVQAAAPEPDVYETNELPNWQDGTAIIPASDLAPGADTASIDAGMSDKLAALDDRLASLEASLAKLSGQFEDKISRSEHEATVLKQVSAEVEEYRNGLYEKLTMPLIRDMIEVRGAIGSMLARHAAGDSVPIDEVRVLSDMLADSLESHSVEIVASEPGDEFLSLKHKTVGQVPTTDEGLHGRIAEIEGESYRLGDQYIAPALVKVYTLER